MLLITDRNLCLIIIKIGLDQNKTPLCISLDLLKGFDTVNHSLLPKALNRKTVHDTPWNCIPFT